MSEFLTKNCCLLTETYKCSLNCFNRYPNMAPFYFKTSKAKKQAFKLVDDENYVYEMHSKSPKAIYWKCERCYYGCKSRIHTTPDEFGENIPNIVHRSETSHNHPADKAKVAARAKISDLKNGISVSQSCVPTRELVGETVSSCNAFEKMQLPNISSISRNVRRWRNAVVDAPANPTERTGFTIPDRIAKYQDGSDFLVFDSGKDDHDRILIFSNTSAMTELSRAEIMAIDGTFKLCPLLWTQLVTVHAVAKDLSVPFLFGLLPNKCERTYDKFLSAVKSLMPDFHPKGCICDFEKGLQNSLVNSFDGITIHSCLFHMSQSCWRKLSEIGMQKRYNTDDNFKLLMKSFCALAFLPTSAVIPAFEKLVDCDEIPSAFVSYFEYTYIGIRRGRGERQQRDVPLFPINLWNVRSRVENDLPRSNNAVEGFHNALRSSITSSHPNLWRLLKALKQELEYSAMKHTQLLRGDMPSKKKAYQIVDTKIKRQLEIFDNNGDIDQLLTNLANVIKF